MTMMMIGFLCFWALPGDAAQQTLTIAIESDPTNIDPRFGTDVNSSRVHQIVGNGLIQKDAKSNLVPDLAERWENPDEKTYIFHLKKGITFHDGTELTAEDVKFTFESIIDPEMNSPKAGAYQQLDTIEVLDPYTVKFTLKDVFAPFLIEMAHPIMPKQATEAQRDRKFTESLVGTGPFKLVDWKHDEELVFEANPEYFEGAPKLEKIIFKVIPEEKTRFLELAYGKVDFVQNALDPQTITLIKNGENLPKKPKALQVIAEESVLIYYMGFNLEDPILSDVNVRQAISYAIDRQLIVDHLLEGQASLATGLLSPSNWAYEPDVKTYAYDPEKAKALLDEAGYPDPDGDGPESRFTIVYKTSTDPLRMLIGQVLQDQFKQVGIEISEIQTFEWAKFYQDIIDGNFQIYTLRWVGITEPDIFYSIFHSSMIPPNGRNRGRYVNAGIDELTERGRLAIDVEERKQAYSEIQKILAEDLPYVFLWYPHNIVVMDEKIRGFTLYPDGDFASFQEMWFEE
jgi:peptide/nickel transport system substrate-binding protein